MVSRTRRTTADIAALLETWLEVEFTFYRVSDLADALAALDTDTQDFLLGWIRRIGTTNVEVAYQFARRASTLLTRMDRPLMEAWALAAMDGYDREGLRAALQVIDDVAHFAPSHHQHTAGIVFDDIEGVLVRFVSGLSGRRLKLVQGDAAYTDSETLYLPAVVARMQSREDNFCLAKALVTFMWAQTRFGSLRPSLATALAGFSDSALALRRVATLEALRLDACIARELPGLHREMSRLQTSLGYDPLPPAWQGITTTLAHPRASLADSLRLVDAVAETCELPRFCYQAELRLDAVTTCLSARIAREKILLRVRLATLADEQRPPGAEAASAQPARFELAQPLPQDVTTDAFELTLHDLPVTPPDDVRGLLTSIHLDLGDIPPDYLVPAGPGEYDPALYADTTRDSSTVWQGTYHEEGATLLHEWDFGRQHYRKNWCVVREQDVPPVHDDFVTRTTSKYSRTLTQLRRTFEAMRDENRLQKRQPEGEDVDVDALVEALVDTRDGREMTDRLFTRLHRAERNIAVVFMVDMSGSTKGWINDAEREALILLCEALEALGDRYAIYGFSGVTRKRCEIYRIKRFGEPYCAEVRARISGIRPQEYTRMGFAIRHLTTLLQAVDARTKLLFTLSDGRPDDYHDGYRGRYGIEDTRQALFEAKRQGVRSFCITLDTEARDYLPHMYGAAQYTIIDAVGELPYKVAEVYRRLTS